MNKEQSKNELLKLAKENPFGYRSMLKHSRKELLEEVLEFTSWMPSDVDLTTRTYCVITNKDYVKGDTVGEGKCMDYSSLK